MKKLTLLSISLLFSVMLLNSGCFWDFPGRCIDGKGGITSETRDVKDFDEVELDISANVVLHEDSIFKVEVEAQTNLLAEIKTEKVGNRLVIKSSQCFRGDPTITVDVYLPTLRAVVLNSSGHISSPDKFKTDALALTIAGSGDITLNAEANTITNTISGSGDLIWNGKSKYVETNINGSGDFNWQSGGADDYFVNITGSGGAYSFNAPAKNADIKIGGSGNIEVNASDKLTVNITGSGNVYYKGHPSISVNITGSGKLEDRN
jgi:hypothetical protein